MDDEYETAAPFAPRHLRALRLDEFDALGSDGGDTVNDAQVRYLLGFSLLAPSSHNTVPQAYRIDIASQRITVHVRTEYVLPASDPTGEEALISVGCAVEALRMAAAQYGVECDWQPPPTLDWSAVGPGPAEAVVHVGTVTMRRVARPPDHARHHALTALLERQVVRAEYDRNRTLPREVAAALETCTSPDLGVTLTTFQSSQQKFSWAKLDELALKHKLEEKPFRTELGQWLLPNDDITSVRGMRGREFGLDDRLSAELSAQLRGDATLDTDQLSSLARGARIGLVSSSALGMLATRDDDPNSAVQTGRVFQRVAVTLQIHGFSCAPHTAVCQVPHARAMAQATLTGGAVPKMLFRIGIPLTAEHQRRPRSSRPSLDRLLLSPEVAK